MRKLTNRQLVVLSGNPYSQKDIKELRLIEKCVNILQESLNQDEFNYFSELMCNGWSDALCRLMDISYEMNDNTKDLLDEYKMFKQHCWELNTCPTRCTLQHICFTDWMDHYISIETFEELDRLYNENN